jgi:hypothetical protein
MFFFISYFWNAAACRGDCSVFFHFWGVGDCLFSCDLFFFEEVQWWFGARAIPTVDLVGPEPNFWSVFRARSIAGPACQVLLGWLTRSGPDGLSTWGLSPNSSEVGAAFIFRCCLHHRPSSPARLCSYGSLLPFLQFFLWVIRCLFTEKLVWFLQLHKESTDLTNSSISRTRTETPNEIELLDNKKV